MSAKSKVVDINRKKKELITFTEEELETLRRTVAEMQAVMSLRCLFIWLKTMDLILSIRKYFSGRKMVSQQL